MLLLALSGAAAGALVETCVVPYLSSATNLTVALYCAAIALQTDVTDLNGADSMRAVDLHARG